jgi:hypothetical protein
LSPGRPPISRAVSLRGGPGLLGGRFSTRLASTVRGLLPRSGSYPGASEFERVRSPEELELIDQMALLLRAQGGVEFLGVPMRQIPSDNWLMSDLIFSVKPDYIIETGTLYGGSALYYASLLELVNPNGNVITVDINENAISSAARDHDLFKRRVRFIRGGSTDAETIEQIRSEVGTGMTVLVTLDTLHAPSMSDGNSSFTPNSSRREAISSFRTLTMRAFLKQSTTSSRRMATSPETPISMNVMTSLSIVADS